MCSQTEVIATVGTAPPRVRLRNRRGEGARLREQIIAAASEIIAETGDDSALTLRGVAKRIGIAAPSIYRHFTDVDDLKLAVVNRSLAQYADAREAIAEPDEPPGVEPLSFDEFYTFANRYPISALNDTVRHLDDWESRSRPQGRFVDDVTTISRIPSADHDPATWSERAYFGSSAWLKRSQRA